MYPFLTLGLSNVLKNGDERRGQSSGLNLNPTVLLTAGQTYLQESGHLGAAQLR